MPGNRGLARFRQSEAGMVAGSMALVARGHIILVVGDSQRCTFRIAEFGAIARRKAVPAI
jgi:hypothetical protein